MTDIPPEIRRSAEVGEMDKMKNALSAIPPQEHLQIIQALQAAEKGNPNLTIDIDKNSSPTDYAYKISYLGPNSPRPIEPPAQMNEEMAKILGISAAELRKKFMEQQGGAGPIPLELSERYRAANPAMYRIEASKKLFDKR